MIGADMRVFGRWIAGCGAAALVLALATPAVAQQGKPPEEATTPPPPPRSVIKQIETQQKKAAADALVADKAAAAVLADPGNVLLLDLSTGGRVAIQLRPDKAPKSVERIKTLTRRHFYDGLIFHRVIDGFMAQTGDPKGDGTGGSDLPDLKAEFNDLPHVRGEVSMARAEGVDSANSQFFIMLAPLLTLDGKYSPVGRVTSGMAYVDAIARGEPPANPSKIVRASLGVDNVPPPVAAAAPAASNAAAAAAGAATTQASDAKVAADEANAAAARGDKATAQERASAAKVSAQGAAQAAGDAAQAAGQAADSAAQDQALTEGGFQRKRKPR